MVNRTPEQVYQRARTIIEAALATYPDWVISQRSGGATQVWSYWWQERCRLEEIRLVDGYAEPGYGSLEGDDLIAFGNWNTFTRWDDETRESITLDDTPERVGNLLEKLGVELEWCDEWYTCDQCNKAVRTSPDSYSWKRSYFESDGEITCEACTLEDPEAYLESLEGESNRAITLDVDPTKHEYVLAGDRFENGFHEGQAADPGKIAELLEKMDITRYVFRIDTVGQFDVEFSVYVHEDDIEGDPATLRKAVEEGDTDQYPSPATAMKAALQDASAKMSGLEGEGIRYAKCDSSTGTADVRLVSPQEFIEGRGMD